MGATEIAMLFLDRDLRIRHYTPGMQQLFNIMPADRGRPIKHFTHTLQYSQFLEDAREVLRKLMPIEREVRGEEGGWFLLRMRPFRTTEDRIQGVIFTFVEITRLKQAEAELVELNATLEERVLERTQELNEANQQIAQARDLFHKLFHANPIPTALIRMDNEAFLNVNDEFLTYFNLQRDEVIGHRAGEFGLGVGLETDARAELSAQLKEEGKVRNFEAEVQHSSGDQRIILASLQYLNLDNVDALITTFIDITERVNAEQQIRWLASELTATEQAERHRLSQVLHDDLQQRIFAIQMQLSFLKDAYEKNDLQAFEIEFPQIEEWLAESIRVTRQLSVDLSPPILHGEGLVEAVMWLASQMQEQYKLNVKIQSDGNPTRMEEKLRVLLFYTVRELLFNVVKHAGTLEASVVFEHNDGYLKVTVSDRGKGFDSQEIMNDFKVAHGLLSIRQRLGLLGCEMEVNSQPGNGTQIIIEAPNEGSDH
jgi:two-component system, chemotaxis family, CheB/CheR fusion protein